MHDFEPEQLEGLTGAESNAIQIPEPPSPHDDGAVLEDANVFAIGVALESALVVLSLLLAWFGVYQWTEPLAEIDFAQLNRAVIWGLVGTVPMFVYLVVYIFFPPKFLFPMRDFVDETLKPVFKTRPIWQLIVLSVMAGFCEEMFFRWCLQGGLISLTGSVAFGLVVASLLFGLCHWVNASYGISTAVIGVYLGLLMIWSDTWLAPAVAHTVFDFVAFLYIKRSA